MTAAKILIDSEGRVQTDAETLERLKNQHFELQPNGHIVPIPPRPRRLHEIEDMEERLAAYEEFKKRLIQPGGENLPKDRAELLEIVYE